MKYSIILAIALAAATVVVAENVPQRPFMAVVEQEMSMDDLYQDQYRLLSRAEGVAEWADPEEWIRAGRKFVDVTDHLEEYQSVASSTTTAATQKPIDSGVAIPTSLTHKDIIQPLLKSHAPQIDRMTARLTTLSAFNDRHYRSDTGVQSSEWVHDQLQQVLNETGAPVTFTRFEHPWPQFSLIARMEPQAGSVNLTQPFVIVSAHYDGVKSFFGSQHMPAADDDGSGTVTLMETFTLLCQAYQAGELQLTHPIEFHWYSAEEVGLRGSQAVAAAYKRAKRPVIALLHNDMTGYRGKSDGVGIIADYVDKELSKFLKLVMKGYTDRTVLESKCGYACSDSASFTKSGYRAAFQFEGTFKESSPYIHSTDDTVEHVDFVHMSSFVEIAVAFALELAM